MYGFQGYYPEVFGVNETIGNVVVFHAYHVP